MLMVLLPFYAVFPIELCQSFTCVQFWKEIVFLKHKWADKEKIKKESLLKLIREFSSPGLEKQNSTIDSKLF